MSCFEQTILAALVVAHRECLFQDLVAARRGLLVLVVHSSSNKFAGCEIHKLHRAEDTGIVRSDVCRLTSVERGASELGRCVSLSLFFCSKVRQSLWFHHRDGPLGAPCVIG